MQDWLAARALASPDKIALSFEGQNLTYEDLLSLALKSYVLIQTHIFIKSGDKVAILLPTGIEYIATVFALIQMGAVLVPLNTHLTPEEIAWQINNTDCNVVICNKKIDKTANQLKTQFITIISYDETDELYVESLQRSNPKVSSDDRNLIKDIDLDAPFVIIHTSGTSGKPKGAMLTYGNVFYSALASAYRIGHLPDDKWLCVLPLFHVGGLSIILRAILYGITVDLREKFDVNEINHALTHDDITLVSLVPTMLYRLLEARTEAWNPKLRLVLLGGAAASPELMQRCIDENIPVATTYGLSEAASQVATTLPGDATRKPGTVGKPLMFTQLKIVDEQGKPQPENQYGEILVKGETIMQGYYNNPEATAKSIQEGWLHTGDIGYLDDDGDLFLVQRRSDLIVTGGENVYPAEVEAVLRQHPVIKAAAVIGIPDPEWGQKVVAAIVLVNGQALSENDIETYCREHLAGYKIPRMIHFVDELPLTGSGKIQRKAVHNFFEGG